MQQPAWNNNSWGYDTINAPFAGGTMYLENNYAFLQQAGQWYTGISSGTNFNTTLWDTWSPAVNWTDVQLMKNP